mgnify:CR=1 FL=1
MSIYKYRKYKHQSRQHKKYHCNKTKLFYDYSNYSKYNSTNYKNKP